MAYIDHYEADPVPMTVPPEANYFPNQVIADGNILEKVAATGLTYKVFSVDDAGVRVCTKEMKKDGNHIKVTLNP